jgi:CRISPR/Cas system-associated endonuclease Cas3-HD
MNERKKRKEKERKRKKNSGYEITEETGKSRTYKTASRRGIHVGISHLLRVEPNRLALCVLRQKS